MNEARIVGTLQRDPFFKDGDNWRMAKITVLPSGQDKGGIDLTAWNECADALKGVKQGATVTVIAKLANRKRTDFAYADAAKAGKPVYVLEVSADPSAGGSVTVGTQPQQDIPF